MKQLLFCTLTSILLNSAAFASPECDWSIQVQKDESWRIGTRNTQIGQLNATLATDKNALQNELLPLADARNHTVSVYDHQMQVERDSQIAVKQAILFVQETIISNRSIKTLLEQLKRHSQLSPDRSLADQLREAAKNSHVKPNTKDRLDQLASAVALLESEQSDWRTSESEILKSYLEGKSSLIEGLLEKLNQLNEQLATELSDLDNSYQHDEISATEATKNATDMQDKISGELNQIDELQKANDTSSGRMQRWNVKTYCPPPSQSDLQLNGMRPM